MANTVFIPELIAAGVESRLEKAIQLYPLAYQQDLSNEKGGDVITVPKTANATDAGVVAAGALIPVVDFTQTTDQVNVLKYGQGFSFTEEEVNSAYSNVQEDAENNVTESISGGIEAAMFASLKAITGAMVHAESKTALDVAVVGDALVKFGERVHGEKYLLVNSAEFANLRKDPNFVVKANDKVDSVGEVFGCAVLVSDRVDAKEAYIIKPDAIGLYLKKQPKVETDKDISNQTHLVVGTTLAAVHLRNEASAIKITIATAV